MLASDFGWSCGQLPSTVRSCGAWLIHISYQIRVRAGQVHDAYHVHVAELAEFLGGVMCPSTGGIAPLANAQGCDALQEEQQRCRMYELLLQGGL